MADEDGFRSRPNCGMKKGDLQRGFTNAEEKEEPFVSYGDYVGDTTKMPFFQGGFLGRPQGWER